MLSDGDLEQENSLRKLDHYSFIHRILVLNNKARAEAAAQEDKFGRKK